MIYVILYLIAIILANLSVTHFGISAVIINAFLFIGLDLTARDKLHDIWQNENLFIKMAMLIASGSFLSYLLNKDAGNIAIASFVAFALTAVTDTLLYQLLNRYSKFFRINGSNIPSALVDSMVFPTLAFGSFLWVIVLGQFIAKVLGGFVWSLIFTLFQNKKK